MGFLDKLKGFVKPNVPNNLSDEDLLSHFGATISGLVEARLDEMENWLEETNGKLAELFNDYSIVAATDQFSIKFNSIIKSQVALWLATDDALRARFNTYWDAYSQKIKSTDMIAQLKKSLEDLDQDLLKHTKKANSYGCKWATRADKAGLVIRDAQTRNVIKWFSELTPQSLRADYIRERREKKT